MNNTYTKLIIIIQDVVNTTYLVKKIEKKTLAEAQLNPPHIQMSLAELIVNFCNELIITTESEMYGMNARSDESLGVLQTERAIQLFAVLITNYLNEIYVYLIKQNDSFFLEKFEAMCKICDHSIICLLQNILTIMTHIHVNLTRYRLNTKTYYTYMTSIKKQLFIRRSMFIKTLNENEILNSHQCNKIDITECDPNCPLFILCDEFI